MIELLSIDLSNRCSKQCSFCYNHSGEEGATEWIPSEVISFASDCIANGVKAISLGGGEPLEYLGVFDIISDLKEKAFVSVTTNGLPLLDESVFEKLKAAAPDKVHITIHFPDDAREVERVCSQIEKLQGKTKIMPGVNLLVDSEKTDFCKAAYQQLRKQLSPKQIILVPRRYQNTPIPNDLANITGGEPFQSPSCLLKCGYAGNFCSVSWDKKVNWCSFAGGKSKLEELTFDGLMKALSKVAFSSCSK